MKTSDFFDRDKIHELYPGAEELLFPPQLIHKGTDAQLRACDDGTWFAQLKKDGALYMYIKGLNGENYLFGRTVSKKTGLLTEKSANVPHIIKAFHDIPNGTIIIGEIYYPGKSSKDVTSIMGCLAPKAIERQNGSYGPIHYYIYDCLGYNGTSLLKYDNWTRYQVIRAIYEKFRTKNSYLDINTIELAEAVETNIYQAIGMALAAGEEGMVVKKKTAFYEPGKRPQTMLKAKQVDYIDAVIIGFKDPEIEYKGKDIQNWQYWIDKDSTNPLPVGLHYGEEKAIPVTKHYYYGWHNAIEIGAYDKNDYLINIGTIASGLTDELRENITKYPELYLYRVIKIQCMSKDNKEHTLRHGFFIGFHDDKDYKDCRIEDIFNE